VEIRVSGRDTSFYYSFLVLPAEKRKAITAVWDFCRAVDDAIDDDAIESSSITCWRDEVARLYEAREPGTAQGRGLAPHIKAFNLPRSAFEDLIDGVEMDLGQQRYETFESLRQYCIHVASAVGLICVEIFGYRDVHTRDYAIDLGIALQLTNIIRDIPEDLRRGRLYVPIEDMKRFECGEDDLRAGVVTDKIWALLRFECDRAKAFYRKADEALPALDARRLVAARIMAAIYFELLRSIERRGYDVFRRVIRVPRPKRAAIAAIVWAKAAVGLR
jgi:phytoene synthase